MHDIAIKDLDAEADEVAKRVDTALPRALAAVAKCLTDIDGVQVRLRMAGIDARPVAYRLQNPADLAAARLMINSPFDRPAPNGPGFA